MSRTDFERATLKVESDPAVRDLDAVDATYGRHPEEGPGGFDRYFAFWYPRYVAAIERNATGTTSVYLANFRFDGSPSPGINMLNRWNEAGRGAAEGADGGDDMMMARGRIRRASDRLFSTILPNMSNLTRLTFENCVIETEHVRSFFENLPHEREINYFSWSNLNRECVRLVAAALRRNLRLHELWITGNRINYDLYKNLCDAAVENGNVRLLAVCPNSWEGERLLGVDAVRQVLCNRTSSVRHFRICCNGGWGPHFFEDVVRMLRTNVTLEAFDYIYLSDPTHFAMLLDVVRTYNFTLRDIALWSVRGWGLSERQCHARVKKVLARNKRLMKAYDRLCLQVPRLRRGGQPLGPEAIARIRAFPTLAYRLLRHRGLAVALVDQAAEQQRGRRRNRRSTETSAT